MLSDSRYNGRVGLALFCPITSQIKGYPFEVTLPPELGITGVVLADQVKSLDWRIRNAEIVGRLPAATLIEILEKLTLLLSQR